MKPALMELFLLQGSGRGHDEAQQVIFTLPVCVCVQAIIYEGQDKNPEMCRVLLTHEIMCR